MRRQYYISFDGVEIPPANRKEDISSHEAKSGIIETAGGYIDGYSDYAPVSAKEISVEFDLVGDRWQDVDEKLEDWKSLVSKKGQLYRRIGNTRQWAYARLMNLEAETDYQAHWGICNVTLNFEIISPSWYGHTLQPWYFDDGSLFDEGLYFDTVNKWIFVLSAGSTITKTTVNHGNQNVTDTIITIKPAVAIDTGLELWGGAQNGVTLWHLIINEALPADSTLVVDTQRKTAKLTVSGETTSIYKSIEIGSNHRSMSWAEIVPGVNSISIKSPTAGQIDIEFDYVDKWR